MPPGDPAHSIKPANKTASTTTTITNNTTNNTTHMPPPSYISSRRLSAHELAEHFDQFELQDRNRPKTNHSAGSDTTTSPSVSTGPSSPSRVSSAPSSTTLGSDFALSPRSANAATTNVRPSKAKHHSPKGTHHSSHGHRMSSAKERYVSSNFRFLVRHGTQLPASPDDPLDWHGIELVLVPETHSTLCPICLDIPSCARFTRCGHIYCWTCLLQFFATSDAGREYGANWRLCPVCAEPIHLKQLRPVHFCPTTEPAEGRTLSTVLIRRPMSSLFIAQPQLVDPSLRHDNATLATLSPFTRLIPVSAQFMLAQVHLPEREHLQRERHACESSLEQSFLTAALAALEEKIAACHGPDPASPPTSNNNNSNADPDPEAFFYYHQARDGLNVFLHPVSMKILRHEYGEYWLIPGHLEAPVLQCERVLITAGTRKRYRHLEHLPNGSQIILVEIDLAGLVAGTTLRAHERELAARRAVRQTRTAAAAAATHRARSILDEWRQMEDDYYTQALTSSGIPTVPPPEVLNLNDLHDAASFPSIAGASAPISVQHASGRATGSWSFSDLAGAAGSFADAAASPPSFSLLAHSLNSPFLHAHSAARAGPFPGLLPLPPKEQPERLRASSPASSSSTASPSPTSTSASSASAQSFAHALSTHATSNHKPGQR